MEPALILIVVIFILPLFWAPTRKAVGLLNIIVGTILTLTGLGAVVGIPMIFIGAICLFIWCKLSDLLVYKKIPRENWFLRGRKNRERRSNTGKTLPSMWTTVGIVALQFFVGIVSRKRRNNSSKAPSHRVLLQNIVFFPSSLFLVVVECRISLSLELDPFLVLVIRV